MTESVKSVITCDMEGRIETYNKGAEEIFGYKPEEVIGKKRVSLFSPGEIVLQSVPGWLKTATQDGEYAGETVFLRQDGTPFPARIRITPTFRKGVQIGYCGITEVMPDARPQDVAAPIKRSTRIFTWMVITRAPFLSAILIPMLIGAAYVAYSRMVIPFPWGLFFVTLLAGITMHIAANTFNDYFDWRSGADQANNNYFMPFSGGSRSIELGLIGEKSLFRVASISLAVSALAGLWLALNSGWLILAFGILGGLAAYFYTAPPLRLAARKGLGELMIFLNFGPLATAGAVYALTGQLSWNAFLIGAPVGFLTTAILWINQFPDLEGDASAGKINLVVLLGRRNARWGYLLLLAAAYASLIALMALGIIPLAAVIALGSLPLAVSACRVLIREYDQRTLIRANATTIKLQMAAGLLVTLGLVLSLPLARLMGS